MKRPLHQMTARWLDEFHKSFKEIEDARTLAVPRFELRLQRGIAAGSVETVPASAACVQQERQQVVA
jgi:hypothetical protein